MLAAGSTPVASATDNNEPDPGQASGFWRLKATTWRSRKPQQRTLADFGTLWDRANLEERKQIYGAVFDAVYVQDRGLVAVQVRGPFRRLLGDVANHVRMVSGPGEVVVA